MSSFAAQQQHHDAFIHQMKVFNGQIRHLLEVHGGAVDLEATNPEVALAVITELNRRIAAMIDSSQR